MKMPNTLNSFNILNKVDVQLNVLDNPFQFQLEELFEMGARVNPKRSFLFISKLLGKHLEVHPDIPKLSGHLLANLFTKHYEDRYFSTITTLVDAVKNNEISNDTKHELTKRYALQEKVLFIGFAETATGIGHAVFSGFDNAYYVHTTREEFVDKVSVFDFQEEHSHATDHLCYALEPHVFDEVSRIVLIDDEITTGNTCLNLIRSLHALYPNKAYTIMALLDWRTKEQEARYRIIEQELGISIDVLSLLRGSIELHQDFHFTQPTKEEKMTLPAVSASYEVIHEHFQHRIPVRQQESKKTSMVHFTGRFGLDATFADVLEEEAKRVGNMLLQQRKGNHTLCIGHGEFMYIPSRIASYMGEGVAYKSSTRSPIFISQEKGYPIHDKITYQLANGVTNYLYNIESSSFDEVIMFFEEEMDKETLDIIYTQLIVAGIPHIQFVMI